MSIRVNLKRKFEFLTLLPWYVQFAIFDALGLLFWLYSFHKESFMLLGSIFGLMFLAISLWAFFVKHEKYGSSEYQKWKERCEGYREEKLKLFK